MANEPIPVYVFTGFLESGKTKFIQDILADPNFTENERTVLLLCEKGGIRREVAAALRHRACSHRVRGPSDTEHPQARGAEIPAGPHSC